MSESEDERVRVSTYVPEYQKTAWADHAASLDMSQSEFVRSMVQAGRRGFQRAEPGRASSAPDPGGESLETRVVDILSASGPLSWEELLTEVSDDVESRLDDALGALQNAGRVQHSGREGGYVLRNE